MLFSRSEGHEVEPPRNTFVKSFGNFYRMFFYKERKRTQRSERSFEKNGCPTLIMLNWDRDIIFFLKFELTFLIN